MSRVLVAHPGSNHLAYHLVAALQASGQPTRFLTGYFHRQGDLPSRLARALPASLGERLARELKRRFHPGVDPASIAFLRWPELAYVALNRMGVGGERLARVVGWRNDVFDRFVARRVRRERPDIVIGHDGSALDSLRAARAIGAAPVLNQVVGHVEAALALFEDEAARAPEFAETLVRLPERIIARHRAELAAAKLVLAPSDYVRDTLVERGTPGHRILVLPYGVDTARFTPGPARAGARPFRVLFVGALSQRKGIRDLLEAMKRLALPEAELVLVGRMVGDPAAFAPYAGMFRHVAHVPYHEVHRLYQDADLFVFPSLHEGSAFVTYEALASGLPVITTPNAGSVVRDGIEGLIVPIRAVERLMAAIDLLYRDAAMRSAMAERARARALDYTWDAYRARLLAGLAPLMAATILSK